MVVWGSYPISKITKKMYEERVLELNEKYIHNYIGGIHVCGRMIFRKAKTQGMIKTNPTEDFQLPRKQQSIDDMEKKREEIFFFEKEDLAHFLKLTQTNGLEMVIWSSQYLLILV
ncbi:hypothetical protein ACSHUI_17475 [Bacillus subtilis]|nr:hypothetical protein [Bacillus subtilis]GLI89737.1 hypothetical protein ANABIO4_30890 [Bacillus subtilis]